ncbi:MAG TPA: hypothetical protein VF170_07525 [Planctomycetaceae bacterium]
MSATGRPPTELTESGSKVRSGLEELQQGVGTLSENLKITTVDKDWGLAIFGSLQGRAL